MTTDRFQLVISRRDWHDLKLGYWYTSALPALKSEGTADTLFTVETDQIETYHWDTQVITLTQEGTHNLIFALQSPQELKEPIQALNRMKESLGWGDRLDLALYTKGFLVRIGEELLYGGIFLDALSQMAINYPVIRATLNPEGRAVFSLLPIHIPFFVRDPIACEDVERQGLTAREAAEDWRQFPEEMKRNIREWGSTELAVAFRSLIRSAAIRVIMERSGKIRE